MNPKRTSKLTIIVRMAIIPLLVTVFWGLMFSIADTSLGLYLVLGGLIALVLGIGFLWAFTNFFTFLLCPLEYRIWKKGGYNPVTYRASIRLSIPLWGRASDQDKRETVIHEACHVIVGFKFGQVAQHGPEWKEAMRACGVEPLRTHSVDRTGLARRQRRFVLLDCPNSGVEHKCRMSAKEFNLLRRGTEFWCRNCGLHLNRESAVEEDGTANFL